MRTLMLALAAASLTIPAMPAAAAFAAPKTERVQTWRGADGRLYCRKPDGRVGIVVGGPASGAYGHGGDRRSSYGSDSTLGAALGALLGGRPDLRPTPRRCR